MKNTDREGLIPLKSFVSLPVPIIILLPVSSADVFADTGSATTFLAAMCLSS